MKKGIQSFILGLIVVVSVLGLSASHADASVRVRSYTTKRGTYVAPSYRSNPDHIKSNNYSAKGNYNPYSGKKGYKGW